MKRREFLSSLLVMTAMERAYAQQEAKVYRIAVVSPSTPVGEMNETGDFRYRAFFNRLRQLGYIEGQNLAVARYTGQSRTEDFAALAREVVAGKPDLIEASGDRIARAFKAATETIPVVTTVADPIASGLVRSLAHPDGNITGTSIDAGAVIEGKRLEFLQEMVPTASRVGYLASHRLWADTYVVASREAAKRMKIAIIGPPLDAPFQEAEYRRVFAAMVREGADALVVGSQPENSTNARLIVELAEETGLPAIYSYPNFPKIGGLMSYGVDLPDIMRHAAEQVAQILRGAKPGDVPFYQPTKFVLTINLKTAKALGITVPPTLIIAADEVIE